MVLLAPIAFGPEVAWGQGIEFLDDFSKPVGQQRDPFEERIETERHDFTQSAVTVGRGVMQIEGGYTYFYKDEGDAIESAHTLPEMLFRVGLTEDIEFRIRWNYAWIFSNEEEPRTGSEDLRYGLKLQISRQPEAGIIPTSALELRGTAPTGGKVFTTESIELNFDYIYQWQLAEGLTFAGSTGMGSNGFGEFGLLPDEPTEENFISVTQSAVLGLELSEANTLYAEWFGIFSDGLEDEFSTSIFNIGVDHYVSDNFVLDIRFGVGLTSDSDDFFTGIGGGYRF